MLAAILRLAEGMDRGHLGLVRDFRLDLETNPRRFVLTLCCESDCQFEVWGVQRVSLKTDARNERSRAAIERLGARYDGTLRRHMPAYGPGGGPRDSAFFSILAEEWPAVKSRLQALLGSL